MPAGLQLLPSSNMSKVMALLLMLTGSHGRTPNILFVLTDDMGWGDVSYNKEVYQPGAGGSRWTVNPPRTPNIDGLAMADSTMLFRRWYTGSSVCSPTRASVLTGRTPQRSCIDSAEGCGQDPAWSCYDKMPLPPTEFTVAEALKAANYSTLFVGKWHLGDFWDKGESSKGNFALSKWPASHPAMHGFDEWHATEASGASSTLNCGCRPDWKHQGKGCIVGGGAWEKKSYDCTNYWSPAGLPVSPSCTVSKTSSRGCIGNLTDKIEGDDSMYIMQVLDSFLERQSKQQPWFAQLSVHTNHEPHPALPEWYHAYNHTEGGPAGDYLGTISQMDHAIGEMISILKNRSMYEDTLLWFSAGDNGAHTEGRPSGQNSASNGLRQCKASLFEGGIRVGGFVSWPGEISSHTETVHSAVTSDILPTVLELTGVKHPHPDWSSDGMSLLPLLTGKLPPNTPRSKPIGFAQSGQVAWLNDTGHQGVWKMVYKPQQGQCSEFLAPYGKMKDKTGPFLFNLTADPTESYDLCHQESARCEAMRAAMDDFTASIQHSRVYESQCAKSVAPTPSPTPNVTGGFELVLKHGPGAPGSCLSLQPLEKHALPEIGACNRTGSVWINKTNQGSLANSADSALCLKVDQMDHKKQPCVAGNTIWMGDCHTGQNQFSLDHAGRLAASECDGLCAVPASHAPVFVYSSAALALGECGSDQAFQFEVVPQQQ